MSMNELFQALQIFDQGTKELAVGRAVRGATEQAQMLNMQEGDEFDKRQQFMQLGQGLAQQLSAIGANPTQVAQASQSFMPQQLQGPQDFFQAAATTKDQGAAQKYMAAGQQIQSGLASAPLNTMQKEQVRQGDYSNRTSRLALLLSASGAGAGGAGGKDLKTLSPEVIDKLTTIETGPTTLDNIYSMVETNPNLVGLDKKLTDSAWLQNPASRTDPQFAAFKTMVVENFNQYRKEITGAAASDAERADLLKNRPQESDSPAQFMAKAKTIMEVGEKNRARLLTNFARGKYDVSGFSADPVTKFGQKIRSQEIQRAADEKSIGQMLQQYQKDPSSLSEDDLLKIKLMKEQMSRGKL